MNPSKQDIFRALSLVKLDGEDRHILATGLVLDIQLKGTELTIVVDAERAAKAAQGELERKLETALRSIEQISSIRLQQAKAAPTNGLSMYQPAPKAGQRTGPEPENLLPGVKSIIAVASGKGGVGKSTVATNLAISLAGNGSRVGLLDADIYGPSIPMMLGVKEKPEVDEKRRCLVPIRRHGIELMSLGFLVDPSAAVIWRGPMVMKALEQLMTDVGWSELDAMVIDLPPGTGDTQLTIAQKVRLSGVVIVTTPQDVALADATRGVSMFRKVDVPVLGIVENMTYFSCPHCQGRTDIFGHGGGRSEADKLGVPFLGEIPIDTVIRTGGDNGMPAVVAEPDSAAAASFVKIAGEVWERLGQRQHETV